MLYRSQVELPPQTFPAITWVDVQPGYCKLEALPSGGLAPLATSKAQQVGPSRSTWAHLWTWQHNIRANLFDTALQLDYSTLPRKFGDRGEPLLYSEIQLLLRIAKSTLFDLQGE